MRKYMLECPITFDPMFTNADGEAYTDEEWEHMQLKDAVRLSAYELFFVSDERKNELLDIAESFEGPEKEILLKMLEPVSDKAYRRTWSSLGEQKPRILLYPGNHPERRTKGIAEYDTYSDLTFLLLQLRKKDIRAARRKDASVVIGSERGGTVAYLKPCCPQCMTILPDNWFNSAGYYKIGVLAPPVGGKTTLLSSWMINGYEAICTMSLGSGCSAVYGLKNGDTEFEIQKYFRESAEKLYRRCEYPGRDEQTRKPPVYTRIIHYTDAENPETNEKEEYLLVGSYDVAGETLRKILEEDQDRELSEYLEHMNAFIYLINPSQMHGFSVPVTDDNGKKKKEKAGSMAIRVKTPGEQGLFQREQGSRKVKAITLPGLAAVKAEKSDPWDIFFRINQIMLSNSIKKRMHMAYTVVKCDRLKNLPELKDLVNEELLFTDPSSSSLMDEGYINKMETEIKKIVGRYAVTGSKQKQDDFMAYLCNTDPSSDSFGSVSWHFVSAGSLNEETGDYESIRRIDPLIGCLRSEFDRLGWN